VSINTSFELELTKLIREEIQRITDVISVGNRAAVPDFAAYMKFVGELTALNRVVNDYCDEANTLLNQR
jgi:hypothetical protein